ncbi:hypothetical protein SAMN05421682_102352 [Chryseobacterium indoltheticum]|uniref:Uncharacterized protein n=2 Tax=Chryseobacterium indoltheticum TaxID=254 RepID=A0A381FGG5_9FLAO|nr:hypothetical protein EG358_12875 [Chryseobacterium indoltheticum]SIQ09974.1 hypothetical protein SAMN05421682_102352 [Chryseobacterium indoltheticum]SUX45630.1 Uncharacterised protein [Chryseobacterium indoltheticum]
MQVKSMKAKRVPGIPLQIKGSFHDTESIQKIQNAQEAEVKYNALKERFFEINKWGSYCKEINVAFTLCDSSGNPVQRSPIIGDYIKILLSESNKTESADYQWVRIDMIDKSNPNRLMMQCRPSKLPGNEFAGKTVHYHSLCTTSTFVISKGTDYIKMAIYGRNEKPNQNTDIISSIKNMFIAFGGMVGASKIQWQQLSDGMVNLK